MVKIQFMLPLLVLILVTGCSENKDILYQTSTINALLAGVYDGEEKISELTNHGDFGVGTFDGLDGEMIVLDGTIYQVKDNGLVYLPRDGKTPFAAVTFFEPDTRVAIGGENSYSELTQGLDAALLSRNFFYALKIEGEFEYVKTRSVPKQERPYPRLIEVTQNQPEFEFENVRGTVVGFRLPDYVQGINVPGYHLHFITEDRKAGGHLLDFKVTDPEVEIDYTYEFYLKLPRNDDFAIKELSDDNRQLDEVEK